MHQFYRCQTLTTGSPTLHAPSKHTKQTINNSIQHKEWQWRTGNIHTFYLRIIIKLWLNYLNDSVHIQTSHDSELQEMNELCNIQYIGFKNVRFRSVLTSSILDNKTEKHFVSTYSFFTIQGKLCVIFVIYLCLLSVNNISITTCYCTDNIALIICTWFITIINKRNVIHLSMMLSINYTVTQLNMISYSNNKHQIMNSYKPKICSENYVFKGFQPYNFKYVWSS